MVVTHKGHPPRIAVELLDIFGAGTPSIHVTQKFLSIHSTSCMNTVGETATDPPQSHLHPPCNNIILYDVNNHATGYAIQHIWCLSTPKLG